RGRTDMARQMTAQVRLLRAAAAVLLCAFLFPDPAALAQSPDRRGCIVRSEHGRRIVVCEKINVRRTWSHSHAFSPPAKVRIGRDRGPADTNGGAAGRTTVRTFSPSTRARARDGQPSAGDGRGRGVLRSGRDLPPVFSSQSGPARLHAVRGLIEPAE